ncbi:Bax inhibitor-1/YccA family protein [Clostridium senegalense]
MEGNSFQVSQNKFIGKTLLYMTMGLILTFIVSYALCINEDFIIFLYYNQYSFFVAIVVEIGLVSLITRKMESMSVKTGFILFLLYSVISGVTFSAILLAYSLESIIFIFFIAALMFLCSGMIGMTTKRDLSTLGRFAIMSLVGIIIVSIINMILGSNDGLFNFINYVGMIIFCALTAYDMQKIKIIHKYSYELSPVEVNKFAILAALNLYLDLINIFIYLLRLLGRKR